MKRSFLCLIAWLLFAAPSVAAESPCGAVLCLTDLSTEEARRVVAMVDTGRTEHPEAFLGLARIRASIPDLEAASRGRHAVVGPSIVGLGEGATAAILERLVLTDDGSTILSPTALAAWELGLIDSLGRIRDPRAAGVLDAVCRSPHVEPEVLRVAASALGRLETDSAAVTLVEASHATGDRGRAVLAGMGHCRRLVVARRLAEALPEQHEFDAHRDVARSLATVANSLVWRAELVTHPDEGEEIRSIATRALLFDFITRDEAERSTLVKALMVVDDPETNRLIDSQRASADPELLEALDDLQERLENNPVSRLDTPKR